MEDAFSGFEMLREHFGAPSLADAIRSEIAFARLEDKLRHARLPWWKRWFA